MSDKISICLVNNNKAPVKNLSGFTVTGLKGESSRAKDISIDLIKGNEDEVNGLKEMKIVGADYTRTDSGLGDEYMTPSPSERSFAKGKSFRVSNYQDNFEELSELGVGGFGTVFKVKDKIDEQIYAVKRINMNITNQETIEFVLREVRTLAKINSDRVVRYFNSWMENNSVFIKMEFCSDNLKNVIQQKREAFQRTPDKVMDVIEYHISCQILRELLECVLYLHGSNPPIIHRDLKPQNVLVLEKPIDGKYLKLCDFGLAVVHDKAMSHTSGVGTLRYMAPEVGTGKYDVKADVYSLGRITEDLFDVNSDSSVSIRPTNRDLNEKFDNLCQLILLMTKTPAHRLRPTCAQVLDALESVSFDKNVIKLRQEFVLAIIGLNNTGKQMFIDYLV